MSDICCISISGVASSVCTVQESSSHLITPMGTGSRRELTLSSISRGRLRIKMNCTHCHTSELVFAWGWERLERTRCDVRRTLAPLSTRYLRVGTAARMRVSSLIFWESSMGTLRSARTSTRLPCTHEPSQTNTDQLHRYKEHSDTAYSRMTSRGHKGVLRECSGHSCQGGGVTQVLPWGHRGHVIVN